MLLRDPICETYTLTAGVHLHENTPINGFSMNPQERSLRCEMYAKGRYE